MFVDAVDREPVKHIERSHPFRVTLCEVVIDRDHVDALSGKRIEEYRQGGHEGLAFSRRHFGDLALVEDDASNQLNVIMDHVPFDVVASGHPMVLPYGLVSFDAHEVAALAGELSVEVARGDFHSVGACETAGC